jgi:hypothetical protein
MHFKYFVIPCEIQDQQSVIKASSLRTRKKKLQPSWQAVIKANNIQHQ